MDYIEIAKWDEFQHYKNRNPIWIKLYNSLLDNELFECLQDDSKLLYILLLMLSSRKGNGNIPASPEYLKKHLPFNGKIHIQSLIDTGFITLRYQDDSKLIAKCYNRVEESRVEKSRRESVDFSKLTAKEITDYAKSIGYELDGQTFIDFYESKGWMIGKNKMKDWRAAVRTWKGKNGNANNRTGTTQGKQQTFANQKSEYGETIES